MYMREHLKKTFYIIALLPLWNYLTSNVHMDHAFYYMATDVTQRTSIKLTMKNIEYCIIH